MNKYLTTAATVALSLGMLFSETSMASADGKDTASSTKGSYVGILGGANWDDVINVPFVKTNTGTVIGGVIGTNVNAVPGLRIEAEVTQRQNEVDLFGGAITADHDTFALMGNAVYDVPLNLGPVHPYALVGLGWASSTATFEDISLLRVEASGVAWQLGTGVNTEISPGITAGVGYRYFQGPELEVLGTQLSDGSNHSVLASLNFAL